MSPRAERIVADWRDHWPNPIIAVRQECSLGYVRHVVSDNIDHQGREARDMGKVHQRWGEWIVEDPFARLKALKAYGELGVTGVAKELAVPQVVAEAVVYRLAKSDTPPGPFRKAG